MVYGFFFISTYLFLIKIILPPQSEFSYSIVRLEPIKIIQLIYHIKDNILTRKFYFLYLKMLTYFHFTGTIFANKIIIRM